MKGRELKARRQRLLVVLVLSIGVATLLCVTPTAWLPALYNYLDVSQSPQLTDAIVVLGGGATRRASYAAWLYEHGYSRMILLSGRHGSGDMIYALGALTEAGIPEDALIVNDRATSTYDEAQQVLSLLSEMEVGSAMIVTDRFHTRRVLATYRHVFQGNPISLVIVAPEENFDVATWWQSELGATIANEYLKMPYYWLMHGIWSG